MLVSTLLVSALQGVPAPAAPPALLVVAPRAFVAQAERYAKHRRQDLTCAVLVFEDATLGIAGRDAAEQLKRVLWTRWRAGGLRYVLLVGDGDRLPVRFMMLDRVTKEANDVAFYGCDLYFGDLARADGAFDDWNAQKDGYHADYFGEVHGEHHKEGPINFDAIDYRPEVGVGRWPVSDAEELARVIGKALEHDASPPRGARRLGLLQVPGWVDASAAWNEVAAAFAGWEMMRHGFGEAARETSAAAVEQTLLDGVDLLLHAGHGSQGGFDGSLHAGSLARLRGLTRLPIVMSAGCTTAYFAPLPPYEDYVDIHGKRHAGTNAGEKFTEPPPAPACQQPAELDRHGFGEQMLLAEGGAIAYFGCNTGAQPCALTLVSEVAKAIGSGEAERLGDAWRLGVTRYYERERLAELTPNADWYPPSIFFQAMKFMLFGDPSLRVQPQFDLSTFARWLGDYAGELRWQSPLGPQTVAMRLQIERLEGGQALRFAITYGAGDKAQVRDYRLLAGDSAHHYRIDEQNGIVLDAVLHEDVLTSVFEVEGQVNVASYALGDGVVDFRIAAWRAAHGTATGGGVTARVATTTQRAELRRAH